MTQVSLHLEYFKTVPGILRCVQTVLNIVGAIFAFAHTIHYTSAGKFYEFTAMTGFIICIFLVLFELTKITAHPVLKLCMVGVDAVWALFYLTAASCLIQWARLYPVVGLEIFFGYVSFITYCITAFLGFMTLKNGGSNSEPDGGTGTGRPWTTEEPLPKY